MKITNAVFCDDGQIGVTAETVWQYDYGDELRIFGLKLPPAVEIHFSLTEKGGESAARVGVTKDNTTIVTIPDTMLENGDTSVDYNVYAWIYLADSESGHTEYKIRIPVCARAKPAPHDTPAEAELFQKAIDAVNESASRAEAAGIEARSWAIGGTGTRDGEDTDNTRYYAHRAEESAGTASEKEQAVIDAETAVNKLHEEVVQLSSETSKNAENAAQSATAAENSSDVASASEQAAIEAAGRAARSESAAAESEKTATAAATAAEKSASAASSAQQRSEAAQTAAAKSASAATASESNASTLETAAAQSAKAAAESEKAAGASAAAASTSEQAATTAAQQTAADRQATETASAAAQQSAEVATSAQQSIQASADQIAENKACVEALKEDLSNKITKFYASSQGETHITDSDNGKIQDMMIYGKSSQNGTPTPENPVEIKCVVNPTVKVTNDDGLNVQFVTLNNITLNAISVSSGGNVTIDGQQYIADYVDVEKGKIYRKFKQLSLKGFDKNRITHGFHSNGNGYISVPVKNVKREGKYISNKYKGSTWTLESGYVYAPNNNDLIFVDKRFTDKQTAIELMQDIQIVYELLVQIEEDLSIDQIKSLKSLSTYFPITNITVSSEQLDGYTVFNYPISMSQWWNYVKQQLNDNRDYIYDMDLQSAEAYVNSEYAVALTELEV